MEYEAVDDGMLVKIVVPEGTTTCRSMRYRRAGARRRGRERRRPPGRGRARRRRPPLPSLSIRASASAPAAARVGAPRGQSATPPPLPRTGCPRRGAGGEAGRRARREPYLLVSARAPIGKGDRPGYPPRAGSGHTAASSPAISRREIQPRLGRTGRPRRQCGMPIAPSMSDQQIRALYDDGSYEVVPHDGMRRTIAQRLTASI